MQSNETMKDLRIVRRFNVVPKVVFEAFTKPEKMRAWWTDQTTFDINLRVGGYWTITRKAGETTYVATGEYLEVERPHKLRYTFAMPQFFPNSDVISLKITADAKGGCVVTFVQSGEDIAKELQALSPGSISESEKGWQQGFDLLTEAWKK